MTKMEILSFICDDDPNSITLITGDNVEVMDKEGKRDERNDDCWTSVDRWEKGYLK